ncbi:MAG: hypothetical protein HZB92_01895 [Euryarchaeota archaeon]|nr:hypothetical protein [Euryarchaeota archaeon]
MTSIIVCLVIILSWVLWQPYTWGSEGTLSLSIQSDKATNINDGSLRILIDEELNITIKISNIGLTNVRILEPINYEHLLEIYTINGSRVNWIGPTYAPPPNYPSDRYLTILNVNEYISYKSQFSRWDWAILNNQSYKVIGNYSISKNGGNGITLPYWTGRVISNELVIKVG